MKMLLSINALLLLVLPTTTLACTFNTYSDKSTWEAAVSSITSENFDSEAITSSVVQSLTFASGITASVTEGLSDSLSDLGIVSSGNLKLRIRPSGSADPTKLSFTIPSTSGALGMDLGAVNRDTVKTRVHVIVGGTTFDMAQFMQYGSTGGGSGFFGIATSDSSCYFNSFDIVARPTDDGGLDDFNMFSINFGEARRDGAGSGDPHFMTWKSQWFDFHGECDMVFLSNPSFDNGKGMDIHIRTTIRREYSYIESAAIKIGGDVLQVSSFGEYWLNGIEGAKLEGSNIGGFPINYNQVNDKQNKFVVEIGPHETITLGNFKDLVSIKIHGASNKYFGASSGLLGSFATGEMLARDWVTVMADDPNAFGQEWQKRSDEPNLFEAVRAPQHPTQKCTLPSPVAKTGRRRLGESLARGAAEKACEHWGAHSDICVYDVMATGDLEVAEAGAF